MTLPFTLTLADLLKRNTSLFLFPLLSSLTLNAAKFSTPFSRVENFNPDDLLKWKKQVVIDVRFLLLLIEVMKIDRLTTLPPNMPFIAKAKAETWQATCSSLSPKCNSKSVYSLFRSVPGSSSSSPKLPNCSSPRQSAWVFADYLRSHCSIF